MTPFFNKSAFLFAYMERMYYLCTAFQHESASGYLARVVRDRSAKPGTAVRIC